MDKLDIAQSYFERQQTDASYEGMTTIAGGNVHLARYCAHIINTQYAAVESRLDPDNFEVSLLHPGLLEEVVQKIKSQNPVSLTYHEINQLILAAKVVATLDQKVQP